ncbi:MAG: putative lipid II flippase FtsW [Treponemataceae bacterium]|nr:putative lipid II flippase FtsW [Treponemataceae bacterium]
MKPFRVFAEKSINSHHADIPYVIAMLLLIGLGIVSLYISSANVAQNWFDDSLYFVKRQLISLGIGMFLLAIFSVINLDVLRKLLPYIFLASLLLCVLTFIPGLGVEKNNARRWIRIPFIGTFQPSEFCKLVVILFLANWFDKKHERVLQPGFNIAQPLVGLFLVIFLIFLQNDFSTAFFIMLIGLSMFFMAGIKLTWFIGFCIFSIPIIVLFIFTKTYRVNRLIAFLNPDKFALNENFQVGKAESAISSGGFFGTGFSGLKRIFSVPEAQSDFIFAGWVEAMGFFGVLIFFAILIYFTYRGYLIAFRCKNMFRSYAAFGITSCLVLQSLFNCGVVSGALPATGIPLPFFSSGGSSLINTLLMCGLVINISKYDNENVENLNE